MPVEEGKRDRKEFESLLPSALRFAYRQLMLGKRLVVHCAQGRDRSVGVTVAILATFFRGGAADGDNVHERDTGFAPAPEWADGVDVWTDAELRHFVCHTAAVDKRVIQRCLQRVNQARPIASPSRRTLKKLSRFFMTSEQ
jgi:tRNA A64-2'-O-ribosylphosphate transferase